jgi:hypothetical protein
MMKTTLGGGSAAGTRTSDMPSHADTRIRRWRMHGGIIEGGGAGADTANLDQWVKPEMDFCHEKGMKRRCLKRLVRWDATSRRVGGWRVPGTAARTRSLWVQVGRVQVGRVRTAFRGRHCVPGCFAGHSALANANSAGRISGGGVEILAVGRLHRLRARRSRPTSGARVGVTDACASRGKAVPLRTRGQHRVQEQ